MGPTRVREQRFTTMNRGHSWTQQPDTRVLTGAYDKRQAMRLGVSDSGDKHLTIIA